MRLYGFNRPFRHLCNGLHPKAVVENCSDQCKPLFPPPSLFFLIHSRLRFIPEGTAVQVPPYVLQRDPRYFSPYPDKFWPDRWLVPEGGDVVLERAAFIPFSHGPANCAGRPLAMTEMRYVITLLVKRFTMSFADGYDPAQWERDLIDRFVFAKGELPVKVTLRETS